MLLTLEWSISLSVPWIGRDLYWKNGLCSRIRSHQYARWSINLCGVAVSRDMGVVIASSSDRESLHMYNRALALRLTTEATVRRKAYSMSLIELSRTNARLRDMFNPLLTTKDILVNGANSGFAPWTHITFMIRRAINSSLHVASNVFVKLLGCGGICAGGWNQVISSNLGSMWSMGVAFTPIGSATVVSLPT